MPPLRRRPPVGHASIPPLCCPCLHTEEPPPQGAFDLGCQREMMLLFQRSIW